MRIRNLLHFISYLKWFFLIAAIILILYAFIVHPINLISIIGLIIFLIGIQMGLDSLSDNDKMTQKQLGFYRNSKLVKTQSIIILSSIIITTIVSFLFLSLKLIFASNDIGLFDELFDVGIDCWALILGLLCLLKSNYDKQNFVKEADVNQNDNPTFD